MTKNEILRPKNGNEALLLLEKKKTLEIENIYVFDLMRYIQDKKANFKCTCLINNINQGWTLIKRI